MELVSNWRMEVARHSFCTHHSRISGRNALPSAVSRTPGVMEDGPLVIGVAYLHQQGGRR